MNKETLRMQMLAGVITEGQYKQKLSLVEINEKSVYPFFDFDKHKVYVELDDIDSVLVYDFNILSEPIFSQDPEEDYDGEIELTFNEGESTLNGNSGKYVDYIDELITTRPNKYGFWEKWANEGYNTPDEPDYDEY